jgi:hypothetical protein
MDTRSVHCPNCAAPLRLPIGDVEALCEYCASQLRFIPEAEEMEVVRTREEMRYRERVAVQKQILRNQMHHEEMDRWRSVAGRVAIAALPVVGEATGKAMFRAAVHRGGGCAGCGCLGVVAAIAAVAALMMGVL